MAVITSLNTIKTAFGENFGINMVKKTCCGYKYVFEKIGLLNNCACDFDDRFDEQL